MSRIRIGISGWTYPPWRGVFYPDGLKHKAELAYASQRLHSIEVNGTFYSLLKPANYATWYAETPPGFVFALKGPKYLTHVRRLKDFATPLANFLASGIFALEEKLGPILWQFPPNLAFDPDRFAPFMAALPRDTAEAARLATGHSEWLAKRALVEPSRVLPMRHAIEARHHSFRSPAFAALARRHGIAIVVGDTAGRWPLIEDVTAPFVYVRMHGDETLYPEGYTDEAITRWAAKYQDWAAGRTPAGVELLLPPASSPRPLEVYGYFDNDTKTAAPFDALRMITHLGLAPASHGPDAEDLEARSRMATPRTKGKAQAEPKAAVASPAKVTPDPSQTKTRKKAKKRLKKNSAA